MCVVGQGGEIRLTEVTLGVHSMGNLLSWFNTEKCYSITCDRSVLASEILQLSNVLSHEQKGICRDDDSNNSINSKNNNMLRRNQNFVQL